MNTSQERAGPPPTHATSHIIQRLRLLLRSKRYNEYREDLMRAEAVGEVSEFYALSFHAILAMTEQSEFASDYLEMAEAVVRSPYEAVVVSENRTTFNLLQCNPGAAAQRCLVTLDVLHRNETLWRDLLIMLCRLGDIESIEAALRSLTEHEFAPRPVSAGIWETGQCDCS